jgi:hypothetical protein
VTTATVIGDPHGRYYGVELHGSEQKPGDGGRIGTIDLDVGRITAAEGAAR